MTDQLHQLHQCWCRLTGQEIRYQPAERQLWELVNNGFTEADLEAVLTFLIWQNKKQTDPRYRTKLLFHRIVGDLEYFNSIAGEANAWLRNRRPPPTDKQKVLAAFRSTTPEPDQGGVVRTIREVMKGLQ